VLALRAEVAPSGKRIKRLTATRRGRNAFFMLDRLSHRPEPVVLESASSDDDIVIDEASHSGRKVSSPAVTDYNRHEIRATCPDFYPGARPCAPTPAPRHLGPVGGQLLEGNMAVPTAIASSSSEGPGRTIDDHGLVNASRNCRFTKP
jgi:hypothetical protein